MAWRNVALPIGNLPQSLVNDFTWCSNPTNNSDKVSYSGINPVNAGLSAGYVVGDSSNGLNCTIPDQYQYRFYMMYNNADVLDGSFWYLPSTEEYSGTTISYISCVDDDTQQGIFMLIRMWRTNTDWSTTLNPYTWSGYDYKGAAYRFITRNEPTPAITSNGGGVTHIAKRAGLLSSIGASNLSDILMVSGGGGGGLIIGEDTYAGKDAGGIAGSGNNSANQTTGYAFGQGESAEGVSGGGGGLYGGYKGGT